MKLFFRISLLLTCITSALLTASAAKITLQAPERALGNRQPLALQVFIDPESDSLSGISGNLSFPSQLFTIDSIRTESSAVSLWITQPKVSEEKYLDGRTHITFEGIFPGGFDGVRSPYYRGARPGILFSVILVPHEEGRGTFVVDDIILNAFTSDAAPLPATTVVKGIAVPILTGTAAPTSHYTKEVSSPTLVASIEQSELINHNAWYLAVHEREPVNAIDRIYVAEDERYDTASIPDEDWGQITIPYVLLYQDRTRYVHVKVVYSDGTYAITTILPVENSKSISSLSRILIGVLVILSLLYLYATQSYPSSRKNI